MKNIISLFTALLITVFSFANNLTVTSVSAPTTTSMTVQVSWDNAWNVNSAPNNHDAVWLFVKAQDCTTPTRQWRHVNISAASIAAPNTSNLVASVPADQKGIFIRKNTFGVSATVSATITLTFATPFSSVAQVNFQAIGLEMVEVPQGAYELGDGLSTINRFYNTPITNLDITSEGSLAAGYIKSTSQVVPASFPKGFAKFYCMKYEISQHQYVTFLNTLNATQQAERVNNIIATNNYGFSGTNAQTGPSSSPSYRNAIRVITPSSNGNPAIFGSDLNTFSPPNTVDDGQHIACNFLAWDDLCAFLDWSALRPMTELEFEKACRGVGSRVNNEYAWGTVSINTTTNNIQNLGLDNEGISLSVSQSLNLGTTGIAGLSGTTIYFESSSRGPGRIGFLSNASSSTRNSAGATYYGIMEMTGNVMEQSVVVNDQVFGTQSYNFPIFFDGAHGDGNLSSHGYANVPTWPGAVSSIMRGGSYETTNITGQISDRTYVGSTVTGYSSINNISNWHSVGGRGVRSVY